MEGFWTQMLSMAFALFLLMDSIGNIPVFITVLKDIDPPRQRVIIFRELLIAFAIIVLFEFMGNGLLRFLRISIPTLLTSGGIILFLIAIKMIFPGRQEAAIESSYGREPFIVPLAIPFVAGPAVLAAVMLYAGQYKNDLLVIGAIAIAWIASTLILLTSSFWKDLLGKRGLLALERLMGLILTLIAVQMLLEGISLFLRAPRG